MNADGAVVGAIGEDALVSRITRSLATGAGVIAGAGDDCAVLKSNTRGSVTLFKTDCVVQDVHFTLRDEPSRVGRKAVARVISDIAAMGGAPQHVLVTLVLPKDTPLRYVDALYAGMNSVAAEHGVGIVGGETSRGPVVMISIAMTGAAKAGRWISRSGAKVGDCLHVTGKLGGSLAGHHLDFTPRLREATWLVEHARINAMMDISDGLAKDLPRMAAASDVGFEINTSAIPIREGCTLTQACSDGEDFELLFATSPSASKRLLREWPAVFPSVPLTCIGRIVPKGKGTQVWQGHGGWDHFQA